MIVAFASSTTNTAAADVEASAALSLTATLKPSRLYLYAAWGFEVQTLTGDNADLRLRHTTDGTEVTVTSGLLKERQMQPTRADWARDAEFFHLFRSPSVAITLKLHLFVAPVNGATGARVRNSRHAVNVLLDFGINLAETP